MYSLAIAVQCVLGHQDNVDVLLFTNNMVLIADSEESLQMNLKTLDEALIRWEMKMNWEKTEVMKVGKEREDSVAWKLGTGG